MEQLSMECDFGLTMAQPKTAKACGACRLAHTACDSKRPCSRCVSLGKPEQCTDVKMKKRGRPRKMLLPLDSAGGLAQGEKRRRVTSHAPDVGSLAPGGAVGALMLASHNVAQHSPYLHQPPPQKPRQQQQQPLPGQEADSAGQYTPLRSPPSHNFPSLPIPSLFHPSGLSERSSSPSSPSPPQPSSTASTSAPLPSASATPGSYLRVMPPLVSQPPVLPRIAPVTPSVASAAPVQRSSVLAKVGRDSRAPGGGETAERSRVRGGGNDAVAESLLSLLVEEMRELRDNNNEMRKDMLAMQQRQQHYDRQQVMILHRLDALLAKQSQPSVAPAANSSSHSHPFNCDDPTTMASSSSSLYSSPSDDSAGMQYSVDPGSSDFPQYSSTSSSSSSSSSLSLSSLSSSSPSSSSSQNSVSSYLLPSSSSPSPALEVYYSGTPSIFHGRLPAAEILSHIPFLSCYDLDASEYPFVVDDFRKPAAVCRMAKEGEAPIMVFVNQAFCDATGYPSHELLGFPVEKISFPDYSTKRSLLPYFFAKSPPAMSIHIPCRPICVPKQGMFRRVLCRHQILYNKQGKAVWVAMCVDGKEEGQAHLDTTLPPELSTAPSDSLDAYMRGIMPRTYERAFQYLAQRGIGAAKAFLPSARVTPLLEAAGSSPNGTPDSSDPSSLSSESGSPVSEQQSRSAAAGSSTATLSFGPPLPISPMQPPPSPLYPLSPYAPGSPDDFSWLLRNGNDNATSAERRREVN